MAPNYPHIKLYWVNNKVYYQRKERTNEKTNLNSVGFGQNALTFISLEKNLITSIKSLTGQLVLPPNYVDVLKPQAEN